MSTPKLELYYFEECPYCQRVLQIIRELKLEVHLKNTRTDSANRDLHLKATGMTQVPCLYIDGKPMFESSDINHWLKTNAQNLKKTI